MTTTAAERLLDEAQLPPSGVLATSPQPTVTASSNAASTSGMSSHGGILSALSFNVKDDISSQELLAQVSQRELRQGWYVDLIVPRERIWQIALGFYERSRTVSQRASYQERMGWMQVHFVMNFYT